MTPRHVAGRVLVALAVLAIGACAGDDLPKSTTATTPPPTLATFPPTTTFPATTTPTTPPAPTTVPPPTTTTLPALDVGAILDGSDWELDAILTPDSAEAVPRDVRDPTLAFEAGSAVVDTSCNTGSVSYTTAGDQITFASLVLTELACDPLADNIERAIVDVFQDTATVRFDNGVMYIVRDDLQLVFFND